MEQDNQQAKTLFDIGWMVAIIEGEGWIILNERKLRGKTITYIPVIGMNNTSRKLANQMCDILTKWKIGHWRGTRQFLKTNKRDHYVINIRGLKRCKSFIDIVLPYMNDKKDRLQLLKDFIDYRLTKNQHDSYGEKELYFRQKLKELNQTGKASTTKH